jgi:hypothetical protein
MTMICQQSNNLGFEVPAVSGRINTVCLNSRYREVHVKTILSGWYIFEKQSIFKRQGWAAVGGFWAWRADSPGEQTGPSRRRGTGSARTGA